MNAKSIILGVLLLLMVLSGFGQITKSDSLFLMSDKTIYEFQSISQKDPKKAAFLSAILPGLGQAYNNQYWKIPIIYGGGIILGHYIRYNHLIYQEMRNAVIAENDGNDQTINYYSERFSTDALERTMNTFRRNRDFLIIITSAFYLLNIVEAHVAAHLNEFEVNDNLSMQIKPTIQTSPVFSHSVGLTVSINLK